jgi:hypothetical protein
VGGGGVIRHPAWILPRPFQGVTLHWGVQEILRLLDEAKNQDAKTSSNLTVRELTLLFQVVTAIHRILEAWE